MSGHNTLQEMAVACFEMTDPGDAATIYVDRWGAIVPVVTAAAETRTLAQPTRAGLMATILLATDGGDLTLTVTGGYDQAGSTTVTFNDAADYVTFYSIKSGTSFYWRVIGYDGAIGPAVSLSSINMAGTTGNQEIRLTGNLADALSIEDSTGDMVVFVTTTGAKEIRVDKSTILQVGIHNTTTQGYGVPLTVSRSGALRVQADDGGVALTPSGSVPDIKSLLGRFLVTADQSAIHARVHGVLGIGKVYDALWNEEQLNGVCGRLELVQSAGTTTAAGYGISSGVCGILATAGTVLVNTNHIAAAVSAVADIKGTVTQTGKCVGVLVGKYDTSNWSDGTSRAKFGYGIWVDPDAATRGILVGTLGSNTTSGMPIGGATALNGFYADDSGAAQTGSTVWRNLEARTYFSIDQTNAAADFYSIRGQIKAASGIDFQGDTSVKACVQGYLECAGATMVGAGAFLSSVMGEIWVDGNFNSTASGGKAAGVMSRIYASTGTIGNTTGSPVAAFMATKQWASTAVWPYGVYIDAATVDMRLNAGMYIVSGAGAPSSVTAPKGSLYLRTDGTGAADRAYINTDGGTTWTAISTAA